MKFVTIVTRVPYSLPPLFSFVGGWRRIMSPLRIFGPREPLLAGVLAPPQSAPRTARTLPDLETSHHPFSAARTLGSSAAPGRTSVAPASRADVIRAAVSGSTTVVATEARSA